MIETAEPESSTSEGSPGPAAGVPPVVVDCARGLDETLRLGLLFAALAVAASVQAALVAFCAMRPTFPLYVLGG
jgi:hypothetical protein